jgi:hypothetical protein
MMMDPRSLESYPFGAHCAHLVDRVSRFYSPFSPLVHHIYINCPDSVGVIFLAVSGHLSTQ